MGGVTFTTVFHMPSYWAKLGQYPRQRLRGRDPSWGTGAHSRPLKQDQGAASPAAARWGGLNAVSPTPGRQKTRGARQDAADHRARDPKRKQDG